MYAASFLTIIIALPIPQMKATNNYKAQGEQFVENLIQGEKLSEKPGYLVFTAPYKLCEGDCSDQEDNFAMVFPLYVGKNGQEQYKSIYSRDFIEIRHTKSYAPFKKRSIINPFTPCPTETTTTAIEIKTHKSTTQITTVFDTEAAMLTTKETSTTSNTIPNIEVPILTTEPNTETKSSKSSTELHTVPKAKLYPIIIIIYKDVTSKMPPKLTTSMTTKVSSVIIETFVVIVPIKILVFMPETANDKNLPGLSETGHDYISVTTRKLTNAGKTTPRTYFTKTDGVTEIKDNKETKLPKKINHKDTNIVIKIIYVDIHNKRLYSEKNKVVLPVINERIDYEQANKTFLEIVIPKIDTPIHPEDDNNVILKSTDRFPTNNVNIHITNTNAIKHSIKTQNRHTNIPKIHVNIYHKHPYLKKIKVVINEINEHNIYHKKSKTNETKKPETIRPIYPKISSNESIMFTTDNDFWNDESLERLPTITLNPYVNKSEGSTHGKNRSKYPDKETMNPEKPYYEEIEVNESGTDDHYKFTYDNNIVISDIDGSIFSENEIVKPSIAETEYMSFERLSTTSMESYITNTYGVRCPKINHICVKKTSGITAKIVTLDVMYSDSEINNNM